MESFLFFLFSTVILFCCFSVALFSTYSGFYLVLSCNSAAYLMLAEDEFLFLLFLVFSLMGFFSILFLYSFYKHTVFVKSQNNVPTIVVDTLAREEIAVSLVDSVRLSLLFSKNVPFFMIDKITIIFVFPNFVIIGFLPAAKFVFWHAQLKESDFRNNKNDTGPVYTFDRQICSKVAFQELVCSVVFEELVEYGKLQFEVRPVFTDTESGEVSIQCDSYGLSFYDWVFEKKNNTYVYILTAFTGIALKSFNEKAYKRPIGKISSTFNIHAYGGGYHNTTSGKVSFYRNHTLVFYVFREMFVFSWIPTADFTELDSSLSKYSLEKSENFSNSRTFAKRALHVNRSGVISRLIRSSFASKNNINRKLVLVESPISLNLFAGDEQIKQINSEEFFNLSLAEDKVVFYNFSKFDDISIVKIFKVLCRIFTDFYFYPENMFFLVFIKTHFFFIIFFYEFFLFLSREGCFVLVVFHMSL